MPVKNVSASETRVLFVPPTRRDAQITVDLLQTAGLECCVCDSIADLVSEIGQGVGAILLTEQTVCEPGFENLARSLAHQPEWSDVPIVVTARSAAIGEYQHLLQPLSNVTLVERPAPVTSIVSAVESAVRARKRQYQVRDKVKEIAQAAEQFQVMANAIPQLAWMSYPDGSVFWFNRRWCEYTGTDTRSMSDWGWTTRIDAAALPDVLDKWRKSLQSGKRFEMEYPLRAEDGTFRTFLSQVEPIRDDSNQIVRWLGTYTDIEEQMRLRKARESLLESERFARMEAEKAARLKDEFLATLSHELRSPLSSILGWAYLIQKSPNDKEIIADAGQVIGRSGESLKALVDDLLDLSRISSGKLRLEFGDVDLPAIVNAVVEGARPGAEAKSIELEVEVGELSRTLRGDPGRVHQILSNLLSNAIRFTPPEGKVKVVLATRNNHVEIQVIDTGEGIDPEFLPYVFDRFRQGDASTARKHGGMGIGLSLVKQFVELHGGTVSVSSLGSGKGSTFTVALPYRLEREEIGQPRSDDKSGGNAVDLTGVSILVVDDDPGVRDLLQRIFSERGAATEVAMSADEALAMISSHEPDLLISDIGMPERDGYELIREVRNRGCQVPAIALTAFVRAQDRDQALAAGFQRHATKPIETSKLLDLVANLADGD